MIFSVDFQLRPACNRERRPLSTHTHTHTHLRRKRLFILYTIIQRARSDNIREEAPKELDCPTIFILQNVQNPSKVPVGGYAGSFAATSLVLVAVSYLNSGPSSPPQGSRLFRAPLSPGIRMRIAAINIFIAWLETNGRMVVAPAIPKTCNVLIRWMHASAALATKLRIHAI